MILDKCNQIIKRSDDSLLYELAILLGIEIKKPENDESNKKNKKEAVT